MGQKFRYMLNGQITSLKQQRVDANLINIKTSQQAGVGLFCSQLRGVNPPVPPVI
ncbi:MAG: hypothetical protein P8144_12365 [Gammaproteobacteria bacterium]